MTATSDFPGGVLNIVTGLTDELRPVLAAHEDVDGIDLSGVDDGSADELAALGAGLHQASAIVPTRRRATLASTPARLRRDIHGVAHDRTVVDESLRAGRARRRRTA